MKLTEFFNNLRISKSDITSHLSEKKSSKKSVKYYLHIHEFKFEQINLSFFKINWINIEGLLYIPKKNSDILYFLYSFLDDVESIKKNTILRIKDGQFKITGYVYREDLNISIQGCTSERTLLEIFTQIVANYLTAFIDFTAENKQFLISHHPV
jgi:hypothetical protein